MDNEAGLEEQQSCAGAIFGRSKLCVVDGSRFVLHHRRIFKHGYLLAGFRSLC